MGEAQMIEPAATQSQSEESGERRSWWRSSYLTLPAVMLIAIAPYSRLTYLLYFALRRIGINNDLWQISEFGIQLFQVALLIVIVMCWERRPVASVGMRWPAAVDLGWGMLAFVIIEIGDTVSFQTFAPQATSSLQYQHVQWAMSSAPWGIALAGSASLFEEMFFRGYVIERMKEISGSTVLGVALGTAVDLYIHSTYWDASYVAAIAFAQVSLAMLYVWRRSVAPCIVAHFLMDVV
jgi:uncharacterized protein